MRLPTTYLPHGGGPWPWMDERAFGGPGALAGLRRYLEGLPATLPTPPRAILCVTAHWEAPRPTVGTGAAPGMLYDYYGFPPETYRITWPAPGSPSLAALVHGLLAEAGFAPELDAARGFDHGTFVPLAVAWPRAEVPTVQLSLVRGLDPAQHLRLGRALAPLRDDGVFIVGSGMSYHNMQGFGSPEGGRVSEVFDAWMAEAVARPQAEREAALARWAAAPGGRAAHPREEHLLPLMVVAGAAGADPGRVSWSGQVLGTRVSAVQFG